jgi:hypothetical protein
MKKNVLLIFLSFVFVSYSFGQDRILTNFDDDIPNVSISADAVFTLDTVANPDQSGINTSANVLQVVKDTSGTDWFFVTISAGPQFDFIAHPVFAFKVHSPNAVGFTARFDNDVRWEQQMFSNEFVNNAPSWSVDSAERNTWVEFEVDLSRYPFNRFVTIGLGVAIGDTNSGTYYLDDIRFKERESPVTASDTVPIFYDLCGTFRWVGDWVGAPAATEFPYWASYKATMLATDTLALGNGWNWNEDYTDDMPSDTIAGASSGPFFILTDGTRSESLTFGDIDVRGITSATLTFDMAWTNTGTDVTMLEPTIEVKMNGGDWTPVAGATGMPTSDSAWTAVTASLGTNTGEKLSFRLSNQTGDSAKLQIDDVMLKGTQTLLTGITVSAAGGITEVAPGTILDMEFDITPADGRPHVGWSVVGGTSSGSINVDGTLTAGDDFGTVVVRATALDGTLVTGETTITIADIEVLVDSILVSGEGGADSIKTQGGVLQMKATIYPGNASNKGVTWSAEPSTVATITPTGVLIAVGDGEVTVTATAKDASGATGTKVIVVTGQSTGVEDVALKTFNIYPNPAEDILYIDHAGRIKSIEVIDLLGKTYIRKQPSGEILSVAVRELPRGLYLMRIATTEDEFMISKFVKK